MREQHKVAMRELIEWSKKHGLELDSLDIGVWSSFGYVCYFSSLSDDGFTELADPQGNVIEL